MEGESTERSSVSGRRSIAAGQAVIAMVGLYSLVASIELGLWSAMGPGAGFFPAVLGAVLALLAFVWFVQERAGIHRSESGDPLDHAHVWAVVISLLVLAAALPFLGFQLVVFAFLMYHLGLRAGIGWIKSAVISLGGSVGVFYLFTSVLHVSLPVSSLLPLNMIGL